MHSIAVALIFNGTDLLTGLISAAKEKNIQSSKLRDGIFKKVGFLICYFLAWIVDSYGIDVGFSLPVETLPYIIGLICLTEMISIIENVCKINPDLVPDKLMNIFNISKEDKKDV